MRRWCKESVAVLRMALQAKWAIEDMRSDWPGREELLKEAKAVEAELRETLGRLAEVVREVERYEAWKRYPGLGPIDPYTHWELGMRDR